MMTDNLITGVTASAGAAEFITDSTAFTATVNLANYVRDTTTNYCYTWNGGGKILTQVVPVSGACP